MLSMSYNRVLTRRNTKPQSGSRQSGLREPEPKAKRRTALTFSSGTSIGLGPSLFLSVSSRMTDPEWFDRCGKQFFSLAPSLVLFCSDGLARLAPRPRVS